MKPSTRKRALENHLARLQRHIQRMEALSRRFSWYRLWIVVLGGVATWAGTTYLGAAGGRLAFFAALLVFSIVALLHRRLEDGIRRFKIWREIKAGGLARLTLDWENISGPAPLPISGGRSLEIDLDLAGPRSLHHLIDTAISQEGSALLAGWLAQANPSPPEIEARQAVVRELVPLTRFRERLMLSFRLLSKGTLQGADLLRWLEVDYPANRLRWLLPVAALLVVANLFLFLLSSFGRIPPYWTISISLYILFYYANAGTLNRFLEAVVQLDNALGAFRAILRHLETYPYAGNQNLARLCAPFWDHKPLPSAQLRKIKLTTAAVGLRMNPVFGLVLNLVLPWDFLFASLAARYRDEAARTLPGWLQTWYQLEALISLANFAYLNPSYTFPQIRPGTTPVFHARALGHPLLPPEQKVCNDFTVDRLGQIAVITGSNMAGKSTFIKTIGANLCLAYAGGPVNAGVFRSIPFRLHTCIRISDSITDGFSYFYAEVKCLKRLLEALGQQDRPPMLYLIDEIFRGTNNRERLIGSRAYLKTLINTHGVGFLATHDLELASLADRSPEIGNYHFRDHVEDGRLVFDYKIRPGPSPTTNALRIMQMEGLPVDTETP